MPNFNPLCGETSKQISARIMSKAWTKSESNNILEFREIFIRKNPYLLYLFIDNCLASSIPKLVAFVKGLQQDIEAVENAVTSDLSNGFVEGTNNKIKMVKRVMYGRCGIRLLKAKLIYQSLMNNYG